MSLFVLVEILDDDGQEVKDEDAEFETETLRQMITDAEAGGYITVDATNYAMPVRIAGVARDVNVPPPGVNLKMVFIEPLTGLEGE